MINDYCAGGLVFIKDKIVILRRFNGVWLFPKGHIDPGETAEIAALREVKEESGLNAQILLDLGQSSYTFSERSIKHFKTVHWFLMEAITEKIVLETEFFNESKLITEAEIGILSFPADQELALKAFRIYKTQFRNNLDGEEK